MSVRSGILAVLSLGPAYGLQIHSELLDRAAHRSRINVGQIYGTLDRLVGQDLVQQLGETHDGLPLYELTEAGATEASDWLSARSAIDLGDWTEILDQLLISSSIPGARPLQILQAYDKAVTVALAEIGAVTDTDRSLQQSLALHAERERLLALRAIVTEATGALTGALSPASIRGYASERPRRGRRSSHSPSTIPLTVA